MARANAACEPKNLMASSLVTPAIIGMPNGVVNRRAYQAKRDNCRMIYDAAQITSLRVEKGWSMAELWSLEHGLTRKPKAETLIAIANALGVPLKAILAKKAGKHLTEDKLAAIFGALDDGNRAVLIAAAEALLKNQKKP